MIDQILSDNNRYVLQAIHGDGDGAYVKDVMSFESGKCYYRYTPNIDDAFQMTAEQAVQTVQAVSLDPDELDIALIKIKKGPVWVPVTLWDARAL